MKDPRIYQGFIGVGIASTLLGLVMIIPEMSKAPALTIAPKPSTASFPSSSELRAVKLKNGQSLGIVKTWGYKYNPSLPPNIDLKILREAIASGSYNIIFLESEQNPSILGWYLIPDAKGVWKLYPTTEQTKEQFKEIFNP